VSDILESYGFDTHVANNAIEAVSMLASFLPDLILLDVMMPEIDGLTMLRNIRETPTQSDIPVIVVSAKVLDQDRDAALHAGADAFLPKPFSVSEFRTTLRAFVPVPDTANLY
jgi:CheY-like chemotaxis protein